MLKVKMLDMSGIKWDEHFEYSVESPSHLIHKTSKGTRKAGSSAGSMKKSTGYFTVGFKGKVYQVHRVIWCILHGTVEEGDVVDHIDGNKANNVAHNLRRISWEKNSRNCAMRSDNTSRMTGVHLHLNRGVLYWVARVEDAGRKRLRSFSCTKHGNDKAYNLACQARIKMIEDLNSRDADYTRRHGK